LDIKSTTVKVKRLQGIR